MEKLNCCNGGKYPPGPLSQCLWRMAFRVGGKHVFSKDMAKYLTVHDQQYTGAWRLCS